MKRVTVKVVNTGKQKLPKYQTPKSAGMDLRADIESSVEIKPMERALIPTGLHMQIPDGYEAQVRPRSGLALKNGITVLNTPGTLDGDFTGNVGVILINISTDKFTVEPGDRIAQLIISPIAQAQLVEVDKLEETERGNGGFGHSGVK